MKHALTALIGAALILATPVAPAQPPERYFALLDGTQEVPPVRTAALSLLSMRFGVNDMIFAGVRLNLRHDQTVTDVHIHDAPPGADGPVILNMRLSPPAASPGVCVDLFGGLITYYLLTRDALAGSLAGGTLSDLRQKMSTGETYINLHTPQNPGGYIRGQMIPVAGPPVL